MKHQASVKRPDAQVTVTNPFKKIGIAAVAAAAQAMKPREEKVPVRQVPPILLQDF